MKRITFFILLPIIIILLLSGLWIFIQNRIKAEMIALANPSDINQPKISCRNFSISGFPFNVNLVCQQALIVNGDNEVTIAQVGANYSIFAPMEVKIFATEPINYTNAFFGSEHELRFSKLEANISTNIFKFKKIQISSKDIKYFDLLVGENLIASAKEFGINLTENPKKYNDENATLTLDLSLFGSGLNVEIANIIDGQANLRADISGVPSDLRNFSDPNLVQNWQEKGGEVKLYNFEGNTKETKINISGNVSLENTGHLNGRFAIISTGVVEQISQNIPLEMQPIIFGSMNEDGSYMQNVSMRNGSFYSGLLPITKLAPLF